MPNSGIIASRTKALIVHQMKRPLKRKSHLINCQTFFVCKEGDTLVSETENNCMKKERSQFAAELPSLLFPTS